MTDKTVFQALNAVQAGLPAVGKDREANAGGRFRYRSIDAVVNALHPLLVEHGVIIAPHVIEANTVPFDGYSKPHLICHLTIAYHVYGPAGDTLPEPVVAHGSGIDQGDKAVGKAASYAYKTFVSQLFSIPTDDPTLDNEHTADIPYAGARLASHLLEAVARMRSSDKVEKLWLWLQSHPEIDDRATLMESQALISHLSTAPKPLIEQAIALAEKDHEPIDMGDEF